MSPVIPFPNTVAAAPITALAFHRRPAAEITELQHQRRRHHARLHLLLGDQHPQPRAILTERNWLAYINAELDEYPERPLYLMPLNGFHGDAA